MSIIITGKVVEGSKIGTFIGYPTINIPIDSIIKITNGSYFVSVVIEGFNYKGLANIGTRPTVSDNIDRFLEVYILDYNGNAYGKTVSVKLQKFIRPEAKFDSVDELKQAIEGDLKIVMTYAE
ncbi:MAG: riboflavin kinase [Rikenellaceae bacterium]